MLSGQGIVTCHRLHNTVDLRVKKNIQENEPPGMRGYREMIKVVQYRIQIWKSLDKMSKYVSAKKEEEMAE